jgi:two-component system phosphate regulon sensor histidine kinase PhoR
MIRLGGMTTLVCATAVAAAISAVLCAAAAWTVPESLAVRLAATVAAAVTAAAAALVTRRCRFQHQALQGTLDMLASADLRTLDAAPPSAASALADEWQHTLDSLRRRLADEAAQRQEAEDARAVVEMRARRREIEYERLSATLASLSDPVLVIDEYDQLALCNPAAERLFGLRAAAGQRGWTQQLRCEGLVALVAEARSRHRAAARSEELQVADPQRGPRWYRATVNTFFRGGDEAQGGKPAAVVVLRDINDERAARGRHAEFVSAVSHEMKTPLAGIRAYVEMLVDGDAEDEQTREEFLAVIHSQADRLQRLVDNLLNLSRIESGVVQVNKQHGSLNDLLAEAVNVVRPSAEQKRITLVEDLSPLYLGTLFDRDQLLQAAINLMSNAVKYTPEGGTVTVRSRSLDDEVQFEVEDTGVGLEPEDCERIFDKFYRVRKNQHMASGTGLGLPLAKSIVEDVHGGRLTVRSTPGQGSTFTVTLRRVEQST